MTATSNAKRRPKNGDDAAVRERILEAAFDLFMEQGYSGASMLQIATRAKVSKRDLYARVGSKQDMLISCISERSAKMRWTPAELPTVHDRDSLTAVLTAFGTRLFTEVTHPAVVSVFRLAIAEATAAPEVARALDVQGRRPNQAPLNEILDAACSSGLLRGDPVEMSERFLALLWGDRFMSLLLRIAERPSTAQIKRRARNAALALLQLYGT
jgi:AcrR family transcriptional regulator